MQKGKESRNYFLVLSANPKHKVLFLVKRLPVGLKESGAICPFKLSGLLKESHFHGEHCHTPHMMETLLICYPLYKNSDRLFRVS
jgi:hypothetical protein